MREAGEAARHDWVPDGAATEGDARYDGCYRIVTGEQGMADGEAIDCHRGPWRIEEPFRVAKGEMDARPACVSAEAHMRAHFPVRFIALLAMRLTRADAGRATGSRPSAGAVREALSNVVGHRLDAGTWLLGYRTGLTDALGEAVGVGLTRRVASGGRVEVKIDFTRLDSEPPPSAPTHIRQSRHRGAPESATTAGEALSCGARSLVL